MHSRKGNCVDKRRKERDRIDAVGKKPGGHPEEDPSFAERKKKKSFGEGEGRRGALRSERSEIAVKLAFGGKYTK